jgi:hypothetical protein
MWAKRLVRHAEDHNKLGEEQGGSRPGRTAIDIANRKALTYLYPSDENLSRYFLDMTPIVTIESSPRSRSSQVVPGMPE